MTSRRLAVFLALVTAALSVGCAPDPAPGREAAPAAVTESDPGVVVVLDDFAAANVMALGVTPDIAYDAFGYATSAALYQAAGIAAKPYGQSLNVEEIAAAEPDVIVGVSLPTTVEQRSALEKLATTAVLDFTADWRTALRDTAEVLGRQDRAARIEALVDGNARDLESDLVDAGQSGAVVSIMAGSTDGAFSPPVKTNVGSLIAGLGLDRPAPQRAEVPATAPFVNISEENLTDHDGSALYVMAGRTYPAEVVTESPLYRRLEAVRANRPWTVSGEMWFGSSPLSVQWVLDDIRRTLLDGTAPIPESQAGDRLQAMVTATD